MHQLFDGDKGDKQDKNPYNIEVINDKVYYTIHGCSYESYLCIVYYSTNTAWLFVRYLHCGIACLRYGILHLF